MGWLRFSSRLILLPSFVSLMCWGCRADVKLTQDSDVLENASENASEDVSEVVGASMSAAVQTEETKDGPEPLPTTIELAATTDDAAKTAASAAAYREGINLASSAHVLSQSAFSPDDWDLIASRWQRAATVLANVNAADENYDTAQQKIAEYTGQHEAAIAKIASLQEIPAYTRPVQTTSSSRIERPRTPQPSTQSTSPSGSQNSATRVSVPIVRRLQGTPVVRVTFRNGDRIRTYDMILDTGASRTLITRRMASELGVVTTSQVVAATASASEVTFDVGQLNAISIGEIELTNPQVSIGEAVNVGLLGNDFLRGYDVSIQTRLGQVELSEAR